MCDLRSQHQEVRGLPRQLPPPKKPLVTTEQEAEARLTRTRLITAWEWGAAPARRYCTQAVRPPTPSIMTCRGVRTNITHGLPSPSTLGKGRIARYCWANPDVWRATPWGWTRRLRYNGANWGVEVEYQCGGALGKWVRYVNTAQYDVCSRLLII